MPLTKLMTKKAESRISARSKKVFKGQRELFPTYPNAAMRDFKTKPTHKREVIGQAASKRILIRVQTVPARIKMGNKEQTYHKNLCAFTDR